MIAQIEKQKLKEILRIPDNYDLNQVLWLIDRFEKQLSSDNKVISQVAKYKIYRLKKELGDDIKEKLKGIYYCFYCGTDCCGSECLRCKLMNDWD